MDEIIGRFKTPGGLSVRVSVQALKHALEGHPEVTAEKIEQALQKPLEVRASRHSSKACLFYSFEYFDEFGVRVFFCVVVEVLAPGEGNMVTAYETEKLKKGETLYKSPIKKRGKL
ncbi:MAG: hypothetical protein H6622_10215 [Halobacteriovoraceae bacterium]|nr:hypothetical protein [Halobacteriovoraceae bacterium]